jgi:hypothetical protein
MDWMDCLMLFLQEKQRQDAMPQLLPTLLIYWVRKELGIWLNLQLNSADHLVEGPDFMLLARQIMRSDKWEQPLPNKYVNAPVLPRSVSPIPHAEPRWDTIR